MITIIQMKHLKDQLPNEQDTFRTEDNKITETFFFNYGEIYCPSRGGWGGYLPFGRLDGNSAPSAGQSALHTQEEVPLALLFLA